MSPDFAAWFTISAAYAPKPYALNSSSCYMVPEYGPLKGPRFLPYTIQGPMLQNPSKEVRDHI